MITGNEINSIKFWLKNSNTPILIALKLHELLDAEQKRLDEAIQPAKVQESKPSNNTPRKFKKS